MGDDRESQRARQEAAFQQLMAAQAGDARPRTEPAQPPPAPAPQDTRPPDPTWSWLLALSPLLWIPIALYVPDLAVASTMALILMVLMFIVAIVHSQARRDGLWPAALLGSVIYLAASAFKHRTTPAVPVVAAVTTAAALIVAVWWTPTAYDHTIVESDIETWLAKRGADRATVTCPDNFAGRPGDVVRCWASSRRNDVPVDVTIEEDGGYSWVVGG